MEEEKPMEEVAAFSDQLQRWKWRQVHSMHFRQQHPWARQSGADWFQSFLGAVCGLRVLASAQAVLHRSPSQP